MSSEKSKLVGVFELTEAAKYVPTYTRGDEEQLTLLLRLNTFLRGIAYSMVEGSLYPSVQWLTPTPTFHIDIFSGSIQKIIEVCHEFSSKATPGKYDPCGVVHMYSYFCRIDSDTLHDISIGLTFQLPGLTCALSTFSEHKSVMLNVWLVDIDTELLNLQNRRERFIEHLKTVEPTKERKTPNDFYC